MATLLRRFLVLAALMFWLGGFTFYGAIVVPIGQKEFGPKQGIVTRQVTHYMNLSGAVALVIFAWDLVLLKNGPIRRRLLWICWAGMAVTLALLVYFHSSLSEMMDSGNLSTPIPDSFHALHRWYLWISTVQWACGVAYAFLTVAGWRQTDRTAGVGQGI